MYSIITQGGGEKMGTMDILKPKKSLEGNAAVSPDPVLAGGEKTVVAEVKLMDTEKAKEALGSLSVKDFSKFTAEDIQKMTKEEVDAFYHVNLWMGDIKEIQGWDEKKTTSKKEALKIALLESSFKNFKNGVKAMGESTIQIQKTITEPDQIQELGVEINSILSMEQAEEALRTLIDATEYNSFKIGGVLYLMQCHPEWWGEKFKNFKEYVEQSFGIQYRKAMYWLGIYTGLMEKNIPWEKVKGLGWTKLKEIIPILNDSNIEEWVEKAKSMTVVQLMEEVRAYKASLSVPAEDMKEYEGGETKKVSTLSFKVHEDQKETIMMALEKAKEASGTEFNAVALEMIALEYIGAAPATIQTMVKEVPMKVVPRESNLVYEDMLFSLKDIFQQMRASSPDLMTALGQVFAVLEEVWPEPQIEVKL
jgi:hypothetical protein